MTERNGLGTKHIKEKYTLDYMYNKRNKLQQNLGYCLTILNKSFEKNRGREINYNLKSL